jgi:hypothetical protein
MDIQGLGAVSEILGSVLVLITLVYVSFQLRQNAGINDGLNASDEGRRLKDHLAEPGFIQ